ncbi:MAG TPA: AAA-like domain-containing protein [Candidatus Acidoferrales bacterium]|nr:AAA-like domain-containing protein [Candidatus Acidoferrales bacterium]
MGTPTTTLATASFYVTGGTLKRDARCYVKRHADEDLYQSLRDGKFCYVLTSRQMGKSSLMVRTAVRLREEGAQVAVLDLTALGTNLKVEQWYLGLLNRVGQQLDLEDELDDYWEEHRERSPLQRWTGALREVVLEKYRSPVVMLIDEIDATRSLPFSSDEFFAAIREFYNRRSEDAELNRLTFCLLGVATPSDLIQDTRTTPFNIGQRIELTDFSATEATILLEGLGRKEETAPALLERILYWTGGHPYLTQRLCQAVAKDPSVTDTGGIDRLCEEMFLSRSAREKDDNLLFVRDRILRSEADLVQLLELYRRVREHKRVKDDPAHPLHSILRLSGITRLVEGYLRIRNRIYYRVFDKEWVESNLPMDEVQRQKAAYRRGVMRTAVIASVIVLAMSILAFSAYRERRRAIAESARARAEAERADQTAQQLQKTLGELQTAWEQDQVLRQRAEAGDAEAEYVLSRRLTATLQPPRDGLGFRDATEALEWLDSNEKALGWLRKSAEQRYAEALNALGELYGTGRVISTAYREALRRLKSGREPLRMVTCQNSIVLVPWRYPVDAKPCQEADASKFAVIERGDPREAVKWFRAASALGSAKAMYNLALALRPYGNRAAEDEAASLLRQAADRGYAPAAAMLNGGQLVAQAEGGTTGTGGPGGVAPPIPVVPAGPPAAIVKQFDEMLAEANKAIANKKYDNARKVAADLKGFVGQNKLGEEYTQRSDALPDKIAMAEKNAANAAFQANLKQSNAIYAKIVPEIEKGDYGTAEQDIQALAAIGEGSAHKEDVEVLRDRIQQYQAEDQRFSAAQAQLSSGDKATVTNSRAVLDAMARGGGRHAEQARALLPQAEARLAAIEVKEKTDLANAAAADRRAKVAQATAEVRRMATAHDFTGARAKLSELQRLGENTSGLSAEIEGAEKEYAASLRGSTCAVMRVKREKWTNPLVAGAEISQVFLDDELELRAEANCGMPADVLQAAQPGSEARLAVQIDANGKVTDGRFLEGFANPGFGAIAAAMKGWHFNPPKVNRKPVKTIAVVDIRFK